MPAAGEPRWLVLAHRAPGGASAARVTVWRRLQQIGAFQVKNSVHVLPDTPETREDFEWIREHLTGIGGDAVIFTGTCLDAHAREEIMAGMRSIGQHDFEQLAKAASALAARANKRLSSGARDKLRRDARSLRTRFEEAAARDFFGAPGREDARTAIDALDRALDGSPARHGGVLNRGDYSGRTWITRPQPGIDRMSSAWLIRRFIDPRARFVFADGPPQSNAIPFDMFGVEFGHHGDACTFETLVGRFGVEEPGVQPLMQVVHDLDLKEDRYHMPEAPAVARLVDGLRSMYTDDHDLLEQGVTMIEALYRSFGAGSTPPPARVRRGSARPGRPRTSASRTPR